MSGHSKWAQIKRQKGVADAKRGQVFTKLANAITIAVKQGGGEDPASNFKLRLLVEKARSVNMPKENIERAIKRAESKDSREIEDVVYEAFTPSGVGLIIEAATDNKLRTAPEIKNILEKNGGTLASPGAVSYQFVQKGQLTVSKQGKSLDDIFLLAADSGAEDVEDAGGEVLIYTKTEDLKKVKEKLALQLSIVDAELVRKPIITVQISNKETAGKILSLIEKIEGLDDVQKVYSNFDIPDTFIG